MPSKKWFRLFASHTESNKILIYLTILEIKWPVEEKEQIAWIACQQLDDNQLLAEVFGR